MGTSPSAADRWASRKASTIHNSSSEELIFCSRRNHTSGLSGIEGVKAWSVILFGSLNHRLSPFVMGSLMKRFPVVLLSLSMASAMAWAQGAQPNSAGQAGSTPASTAPAAPSSPSQQSPTAQPAPQQGAAQTAPGTSGTAPQAGAPVASAGQNNISGCLQRGFATYQVHDSATGATYELRGNGANLSSFENHVVQIQGLPDPQAKAAEGVVFYVTKVQDNG